MNELENVKSCIEMLESIGIPAETDAMQLLKGYGMNLLLGTSPSYVENNTWTFSPGDDGEVDLIFEVIGILELMEWGFETGDLETYNACIDSLYQLVDEGA
jgi:hypothetical protein